MEIESSHSPLIVDQANNWFGVENCYLIRVGNQHHHVTVNFLDFVQELRVLILDLGVHAVCDIGEQVDGVLDLVKVTGVMLHVIWDTSKGILWESCQVMLANTKNGSLIVPNHHMLIGMDCGPLIVLKGEVEDITLEKRTKCYSFFKKNWEVLPEKKETDVTVLVLNDVVNNGLYGSRLVVF